VKLSPIEHAELSWNEQGTPVSRTFDDVYFSNQNGLEETRYVFLEGNNLPARFTEHPRELFITAETGFGTGLNFLTLWQAFDGFRRQHPEATLQRMHFISVEKFPLKAADLAEAHAHWPELAPWSEQLRAQWPLALPGCHRLLLDGGRITLDLWFGDINQLIYNFDDSLNRQVDAWFLDGFAPSKNPEMWTPELFNAMSRLARPGGSFATFTAAGFVRRGLLEAGFAATRRKGFGQKREMLVGTLNEAGAIPASTPWYARPAAQGEDIAIIGGGVASALLALALLRRNKRVTLYCADEAPALGASGNRQGALYPLLNHHDEALKQFFPTAFTFARRLYDQLPQSFEHHWCGVTQLGWDEKSREKIAQMGEMGLPPQLAQIIDSEQVAALAEVETGCGGITYPLGGWLSPAELTAMLFDLAEKQGLRIHWLHRLETLDALQPGWQLNFANGHSVTHQNVVLATGHTLATLAQSSKLPVYAVAGQVSHVPSRGGLSALKQVLCYDGYLTPRSPQFGTHCIGASYRRGEVTADYRDSDQQENRARLLRCLPDTDWPEDVDVSAGEARCGVRCASRDHLPMVGALPDYQQTLAQYGDLRDRLANGETLPSSPLWPQLFALGALGSRGLCSAPLAAEILAAQLCDEPIPLDATTLAALNPNRYWIRKLLKGKAVL